MDTGEQVARPGMMEWLSNFLRSDNTGGVFYGWWLVAIGVLIILVGREIGEAIGRTAYMAKLHDHVGIEPPWNVAAIAGGVIIWIGSMWAAGRGADRLGPRRMVQIGLPLAGLPILFAALPVPGSMQFALPAMAAIALIGAYLPTVSVLNHWFRDRLALALSLTLFGVAISRVVFDWLLSVVLLVVDWQPVTVATGAVIVVVAFPLALLIRNRPEEWGERPDGVSPEPAGSTPDYSWRDAMRSRQFWMLAAAGACVGSAATIGSVYAWQVASQGSATFEDIDKLGSFETLTSMAGILIGGLLSYRFPVRFVLAGAGIVQTVGVALLLAGYGPVLSETGVLLGVASGIGPALEIAAVGIYFGRRSFGMIVVTSLFVGSIVPGVVLPGAGYLRDLTGAYIPIAVGAAVISLIGAALYLALGQPRLSPSQQAEDPAIS